MTPENITQPELFFYLFSSTVLCITGNFPEKWHDTVIDFCKVNDLDYAEINLHLMGIADKKLPEHSTRMILNSTSLDILFPDITKLQKQLQNLGFEIHSSKSPSAKAVETLWVNSWNFK